MLEMLGEVSDEGRIGDSQRWEEEVILNHRLIGRFKGVEYHHAKEYFDDQGDTIKKIAYGFYFFLFFLFSLVRSQKQFLKACENGDLEKVQSLIKKVDVNYSDG